jgi:hypothetical protein
MRLPTLSRDKRHNETAFAGMDGDDARTAAALLAYAADSLSPDAAVLSRMGGVVRAAFLQSGPNEDVAAETRLATASGSGSLGGLHWGRGRRRTLAALCAVAVLTLTSASFVGAESNPGQPFYRVRLSLEAVRIPFQQPADPLQSMLDSADARLADVEREAAVKDWNAAADATGAFDDVIASISPPTNDTAAAASQRLGAELSRLEHLRLTSGAPETAALDKAIEAVSRLLGLPVPKPSASATPAVPGTTDSDGRPGERATPTPGKGHDRDGSGSPRSTPGATKPRSPPLDPPSVGHTFGGGRPASRV